jgi:hypothetical protein
MTEHPADVVVRLLQAGVDLQRLWVELDRGHLRDRIGSCQTLPSGAGLAIRLTLAAFLASSPRRWLT